MVEKLPSVDETEKLHQKRRWRKENRRSSRKYKVELLFRLEAEFERDDKGIVHPGENETLCQRMSNLVSGHDMRLADGFQSVNPARVPLPDLHDLNAR
jgi:hypothetical protein